MSETEKKASYARILRQETIRIRELAEKMEKKAEALTREGRYNEAWECYELAGYLKGIAAVFEDIV